MPTPTKEITLAFQKWVKANYPKEDLGAYGVAKDGVDGIMGAKTKALFDKYGTEFKRDAVQRKSSVIPETVRSLISSATEKEHGLGNTQDDKSEGNRNKRIGIVGDKNSAINELLKKKAQETTANKMGKDFADAEMLKNRGITDLIAPVIGGAYGLSQLIKGNKMSKNLKAPKRVEPMLPNQQLSSLLAQVGVNANMADPKIREQALRDITTNREMANEVAKVASAGDVTSFANNAQNNYLKSNDAVRKLASDQTDDILRNRQLYRSLIGQKMNEDRANHNELVSNFNNIDLPEFQNARAYAANLSNQGMGNIFGAVNNATANAAPLLGGYNNILSGYKARYLSMSPDEKKAFTMKYPKLATKYEQDLITQKNIENQQLQNNVTPMPIVQPIPTAQLQQLPPMPLGYNWQF